MSCDKCQGDGHTPTGRENLGRMEEPCDCGVCSDPVVAVALNPHAAVARIRELEVEVERLKRFVFANQEAAKSECAKAIAAEAEVERLGNMVADNVADKLYLEVHRRVVSQRDRLLEFVRPQAADWCCNDCGVGIREDCGECYSCQARALLSEISAQGLKNAELSREAKEGEGDE